MTWINGYRHYHNPSREITTGYIEQLFGETTKPCPWCQNPYCLIEGTPRESCNVICPRCGAQGPIAQGVLIYEGGRQALKLWNDRP